MAASKDSPLISIITVVRNGERTIGDTLASVQTQTSRCFEHIVIDGASSDRTVEIIRSKQAGLAFWSSEPDSGIADAMNKGISRASGEYVLFLHADDYLADAHSLARAAGHLNSGGADIYAFDILYQTPTRQTRRTPRGKSWRILFKTSFLHQATICRRDLFDRIGAFDTRYKIAMDYEFFVRALQADATVQLVPMVLSVMRDSGVSSRRDWPSLRQRIGEERMIHARHCPNGWMAAVYRVYWFLYPPYRWIRAQLR